uniref:C-22 sterol desaturase n=1 Tax=Polytomella parva TaxID=51329 RepID=A0A7S0V0I1_9CHLO|mmetsp:Transcript_27589/g.50938  ORF Transcript_27589/g.50938 Transcript_27589/m.50938 type:complete len:529 (+) Transcript_27589:69-1655(+)
MEATIAPVKATSSVSKLLDRLGLSDDLSVHIPSAGKIAAASGALVAAYALYEQAKFNSFKKTNDGKGLSGPKYVVPFIGGIVEMVKNPYKFWEKQRLYSFPGYSWHSLAGQFSVFVTDAALCRHIFNHNSEDSLLLALHPVAKTVLGERNIAFLHGDEHKQIRRSFAALFSRKALGVYVRKQDQIIQEHLQQWLSKEGPREIRNFVRDLNQETSQMVFAGPYLDDPKEKAEFGVAYRNMTDAFLGFPLCIPGTGVWKGRQGRFFIIKVLTKAARRSKARMAAGQEPECLLDFWSTQVLKEVEEAKANGTPLPFYYEDTKMADTVMDFLFASQDASTASLVWTLTMMAERPDILNRVRAEQLKLREDPTAPIVNEILNEAVFPRQVVKEVLRYRPPAPMVPQHVMQPFKVDDNYTAPKGTLLIPSLWGASLQGYENAAEFDPDRFGPERKEDVKYAGNFLVFGHGPHYCVGKEYAQTHLACFLSRISTAIDWTRVRSEISDNTIYLPTLYPADSVLDIKPRAVVVAATA